MLIRGVHPPEAMTHSPCFRFPPCFRKSFWLREKFKMLPFPNKNFDFLMTFFKSSTTNFECPPYFRYFVYIPLFRENYYSPILFEIPPLFSPLMRIEI